MPRVAAFLALLWCVVPVHAKLEIQNVQAMYGPLGPVRKSLAVYPFDVIYFRFVLTGVMVDADGKVDTTFTYELVDASGKVLFDDNKSFKGILDLGGGTFPGTSSFMLSKDAKPGEYLWRVTVKDNLAMESTSFSRKITCKPVEFAIVAPHFFLDKEGKLAAPAGGLAGQQIFLRCRAIGIDFSQGKVDAEMRVQVLDADGKEMMPQSISFPVRNDNAEEVKKGQFLDFFGLIVLNRAGNFTLRIVVVDRIAEQTAELELPLRVSVP